MEVITHEEDPSASAPVSDEEEMINVPPDEDDSTTITTPNRSTKEASLPKLFKVYERYFSLMKIDGAQVSKLTDSRVSSDTLVLDLDLSAIDILWCTLNSLMKIKLESTYLY